MKIGDPVRLASEPVCPSCSATLDGAAVTGKEGAVVPKDGDFTLCAYCGTLLRFDAELSLREATPADVEELTPDQRAQMKVLSARLRAAGFARRQT